MYIRLPKREHLEPISRDPVDPTRFYYKASTAYFYRKRLEITYKLLGNCRFKSLLEVGYGSGIFLPALSEKCQTLVGLEHYGHLLQTLKLLKKENIKVQLTDGDIESLPFKNSSFDAITSVSVLEHVHNLTQAIEELRRILKPKGLAIFGVPIENLALKAFFRIVDFKYDEMHIHKYPAILQAIRQHFHIEKEIYLPKILPIPLCLYAVLKCRTT